MKTRLAALILSALLSGVGCHNFPRDSYGQGVKSTINTPWGPSTLEVDIIATGTAAKNISLPETPVVHAKK